MHRFALLFVLLTLTASAQAASFDCRKAASKIEKNICADPELSRLDEQMAVAYKHALGAWQGSAANYVRMDQRDWLTGIRRAADPTLDTDEIGDKLCEGPLLPCLRKNYRERIAVLEGPSYGSSGVYVRDDGSKLLLYARPDGPALRVWIKASAALLDSSDDPKRNGWSTSDLLNARIEGDQKVCDVRVLFTGKEATLSKTGPCKVANIEGRFKRAPDLRLSDYEYSID
ncbi:MAG TPA: lysozyme inhibitor LprI family protein [Arenimonas sp.]|uniref:lysozyme inhibitor LprI family protein n=1 Tax=Arenimonas sp. TaxID=1872635 RepID=UPI002C0D75FB|nr:lysozyme inhibitor LprI family protein [Arenimonas sp.]HMB56881.1 lysozyme inhibitor LprI family protein [Arenimonas sp.]